MPEPGAATRRFYERARVQDGEGGHVLALDGRPARTPGRRPLAVPTLALGQAIAAEWEAQTGVIDPRAMPLTRLANTAIDGVAREVDGVRGDIARYGGSDLVMYRAGEPDKLVAAQAAAWDPVLEWARATLGARFVLSEGVMFVEQPAEAVARLRDALAVETSPFVLAPLHVMTTLTGSALIALMHARGAISVGAAWAAAHVDETYQESLWGQDGEAAARRDAREQEFAAASRFLHLARG